MQKKCKHVLEKDSVQKVAPAGIPLQDRYTHAEDIAQKAAVQYFGEEVTSWLGIEEKVQAVAPTEKVKVDVRHLYEDFNVIMKNGKWYHFEFESDRVTRKDLIRFREYEATTSAVYGVDVVTCVISSYKKQKNFSAMTTGINRYRVRMIWLKDYCMDEIISDLKKRAKNTVQKGDLIPVALSPLLGGRMPMKERVKRGFQILQEQYENIHEEDLRRLQAILYILAQKFLKREEMDEVKESVNMTYLGQLIFDDGMKVGIEKGIEQGITVMVNLCKEFGVSRLSACDRIVREFSVEKEQAEKYLEQFWHEDPSTDMKQ